MEYHRVLADSKRRIGRGISAIFLLAAGLVIFPTAIGRATALIDVQMGKIPPILGGTDYTPLSHASSMIALGLLIPWSMLIQRWLYGVPGASLHSVTSRFRFGLLGRSLLFLGPIWLVANAVPALNPSDEFPWAHGDLIVLFMILLGVIDRCVLVRPEVVTTLPFWMLNSAAHGWAVRRRAPTMSRMCRRSHRSGRSVCLGDVRLAASCW